MKILATFDGSACSESIIPQLRVLSAIPGAEFILLRVAEQPHGQVAGQARPPLAVAPLGPGGTAIMLDAAPPAFAETKEQAVERVRAELADYLRQVAGQLPPSVTCDVETVIDDDVKSAIVRFAIQAGVDLIVMATHGRTGLVHLLYGDVAESVLRSGVAPVLLVHPRDVAQSRL
jgi:nucleotide-binding universal stress UspA family protein